MLLINIIETAHILRGGEEMNCVHNHILWVNFELSKSQSQI